MSVGRYQVPTLLSLSCSGGEASLMADATQGYAVSYRAYTADQAARLKSELGDIVTVANPLDYNTFIWGDWSAMTRMYVRALEPKFDLALLVNDYPRGDRCDDADWQSALDSFVDAVRQTGVRAANVASLVETMPEAVAERLIAEGHCPSLRTGKCCDCCRSCGTDRSCLGKFRASAPVGPNPCNR